MTREERALQDLMPVMDKLIKAIGYGAEGNWEKISDSLFEALILYMEIPTDSPLFPIYKEWRG